MADHEKPLLRRQGFLRRPICSGSLFRQEETSESAEVLGIFGRYVNDMSTAEAKVSDPGGYRTRGPLIKSQMLYH